jgi:hypothetical protein
MKGGATLGGSYPTITALYYLPYGWRARCLTDGRTWRIPVVMPSINNANSLGDMQNLLARWNTFACENTSAGSPSMVWTAATVNMATIWLNYVQGTKYAGYPAGQAYRITQLEEA